MSLQKLISLRKVVIGTILVSIFFLFGCWNYVSKEAHKTFESRDQPFSVTVFPVNIVRGEKVDHSMFLARQIAKFLQDEELAIPTFVREPIQYPFTWYRNQAKMAENSARAFAASIEENGIETDYALLIEILVVSGGSKIGGVHFYLTDANGLLADGGLTNSHWDEFKEVQPKNQKDGYEVAIRMLRRKWGAKNSNN